MQNIDKVEKGVGWIERLMGLVDKYSIWKFLKAFIIILLTALIIGFISNPFYLFEKYDDYKAKVHTDKMELMKINNNLIQTELELLLEKTGADRCLLLAYHNTKESLAGVPFIYLTATHEVLNYDIAPVADGYAAVKTTLYPFLTYLNREEYWCGDIEDLREIDKSLAYRLEGNDVTHLAMINIEGETPLGVLVLTYTTEDLQNHNCTNVEHFVRRSSTKIGVLMGR